MTEPLPLHFSEEQVTVDIDENLFTVYVSCDDLMFADLQTQADEQNLSLHNYVIYALFCKHHESTPTPDADTLQNQINLLQQQVDIIDQQRKQTEAAVDILNSKHKQYAITRSKVFAVENWIIDHLTRWDKLVQTVADNRLTTLKVCENQVILIDAFTEVLADLGVEVSFKTANNITEKNNESNNSGKV